MSHRLHPIAVKQLPQSPSLRQEHTFLSTMQACLSVDRPRIVLDCSAVQHMDRATLQLLLCCLEEAMKRNGDVKLAGLTPPCESVLVQTGVDKLFESYANNEDAMHSFRRAPSGGGHLIKESTLELRPSETAA